MANSLSYICDQFGKLLKPLGFVKNKEVNDGRVFTVEFSNTSFAVKLEKYRNEFYATLSKVEHQKYEVNLFNLIRYLGQSSSNIPESKYFADEDDIQKCYKKQVLYIVSIISDYFEELSGFFLNEDIDSEWFNLNEFMKEQYPELFSKQ